MEKSTKNGTDTIGGFASRLREARRHRESQSLEVELTWAEVVRRSGLPKSKFYRYKDGKGEPSFEETLKLAIALDVDPGWLAFGEETFAPPPGYLVTGYEPNPAVVQAQGLAFEAQKARRWGTAPGVTTTSEKDAGAATEASGKTSHGVKSAKHAFRPAAEANPAAQKKRRDQAG